jgi:hypothetical protein
VYPDIKESDYLSSEGGCHSWCVVGGGVGGGGGWGGTWCAVALCAVVVSFECGWCALEGVCTRTSRNPITCLLKVRGRWEGGGCVVS